MRRNLNRLAVALAVPLLLAGQVGAQCPQYRETPIAPAEIHALDNPLSAVRGNLKAGRRLYRGDGGCFKCHGKKGDGRGPLFRAFSPPPRDFTCAETMDSLTDGQLFWVIRNGAPKSSMPAHPDLSNEQAWQLVLYLRSFQE